MFVTSVNKSKVYKKLKKFTINHNTMMDESVDFIKNCDERNVERNMDSGCPFGDGCSRVHFPCKRFIGPSATLLRRGRKQCNFHELNVYACNTRSITSKTSSIRTVLANNDIDLHATNKLNWL